ILFIESLIEAEEKVLTAQYTSDISDGSSTKQHKRKREIDSIKFTHETGHSNIIRTKKGKISTSDDTKHSKLKTKVYKSKALLTKVQSSESDDNMSDICKHFIIFQLNTFVVIFLSIPLLIHHKLIVL
ncbi:uncharacterized protein LOC112689681, partial [Sipha flava]|uniref:Uncharacterized protein LOC112689681 n=1 Tax=Sipha flava TaxID=143950 RepID=A0A8B8G9L2_9HEMI